MRALRHLVGGLLLQAMLIGAALAQTAPAHIAAHIAQARLAGGGTFSWFTFRLYEAQLWVGDKGYQGPVAPFALDLRYERSLDGRRIAEASVDQMQKIAVGSAAQRGAWLERMRAIFPDVAEGNHLTGIFLPAGAVRFYLDGKFIAAVDDPDFARAFAAIWLDARTTAPVLRAALLKDAAPR
ncbi:MAG: chalcone isomerase family protein [Massilia sp.]